MLLCKLYTCISYFCIPVLNLLCRKLGIDIFVRLFQSNYTKSDCFKRIKIDTVKEIEK